MPAVRLLFSVIIPILLLSASAAVAQTFDSVRIVTWHLPGDTGDAARGREPAIRHVVSRIRPDILLTQGNVASGIAAVEPMLIALGEIPGAQYSAAGPVDGPGTDPACYFNTLELEFLGAHYLATSLRNIGEYHFATRNYRDTIILFDLHLSEGSSEVRMSRRHEEILVLRRRIDTLLADARLHGRGDTNFVLAGDLNLWSSEEPAYRELLSPLPAGGGSVVDPVSAPGDWSLDSSHAAIHTAFTGVGISSRGDTIDGMRHRFDLIMFSPTMRRNYRSGSCTAYGNDGLHYGDSIDRAPNLAVDQATAEALHAAADHLPVVADFVFGLPPARVGIPSARSFSLLPVSPHPASDRLALRIVGGGSTIRARLLNIAGETVIDRSEPGRIAGETTINLDLRSLSSGVYFYSVETGGESAAGRIIITR